MKILMLSWEYPPLSYGGLARHVQDLSETLVQQGHDVYIITQGNDNIPFQEIINGVIIFRTGRLEIGAQNFINQIHHLNFQLLEVALSNSETIGQIDLLHGHDWLVFWAGRVLKSVLKKPLLFTIHATEHGRNQGIYTDMQRYINDLEWYASYEAWKVIVCSEYMKQEVSSLFQVPVNKIIKIENGVNVKNYQAEYSAEFRSKYASPDEKLVFYVGRMVREKGVQILVKAIPLIRQRINRVKFVLAGKGSHLDTIKNLADRLGVSDLISFPGFISDETRNKFYRVSDLAVFPSIYEPFGIVALEAMAAKTPVIASDTGGLAEFIYNRESGIKVEPGIPERLAEEVVGLLTDEKKAKEIAERGYQQVLTNYNLKKIGRKTIELYQQVLDEYSNSNWKENTKNPFIIEDKLIRYRYL